jgi:hypothetical protein
LGGLTVAAQAQKKLLDAADPSGWQSVGSGLWTANGGEIVGRFDKNRPGGGYLFTREVFTDFRLNMNFSISNGGRSGVYVREPRRKWTVDGDCRPGYGPDCGYEVLIDYKDPDNPTGTINNTQKAKKLVGSEGDWNEMEIVCKGAEIRVTVAGQSVNRFKELRVQPGVIGFEVPGSAAQDFCVRFRNISITSVV